MMPKVTTIPVKDKVLYVLSESFGIFPGTMTGDEDFLADIATDTAYSV